jgi:hypothetical protein
MTMNWSVWIVPIIALAVWIISYLLRGNEPEKKPMQRVRQPGDDPQGRPKEPLTDLDRFLREVNRRRQNAEERRTGPVAKPPVVTAQPVEERPRPSMPKPARPAQPPRRQASRPAPTPPKKTTTQPAFKPEPLTVLPADDRTERALPLPASEQTPLAFPTSSEVVRIATPAALATLAKLAPPVKQVDDAIVQTPLMSLLSSPKYLKYAIVMREIFEPPLCRRQRRS